MNLRRRALVGAGAAADGRLAGRFAAIARGEEVLLAGAAAWALARLGGPEAVKAMRGLVRHPSAEVRAHAALGLGRAGDIASLQEIHRLARDDRDPGVRLCAVLGLGYLGATDSVPFIVEALLRGRDRAPVAAALALAEIGDPQSLEALAEAVFLPDRSTREASLLGLGLAASIEGAKTDPAARPLPPPGDFPSPEKAVLALKRHAAAARRADDALTRYAALLERAARRALQGPGESVQAVLAVLSEPAEARDGRSVEPGERRPRAAIAVRLLPELLDLSRHPDAGLRANALRLLAGLGDERATPAFLVALQDREDSVQRTALDLLDGAGVERSEALLDAVTAIAADHPGWSMRARAVDALGRLGGARAERAAIAALGDGYAYVRSAAARALGSIAGTASLRALTGCLAADPDGRVRAAAAEALAKIDHPAARRALDRARGDPHPAVRATLRGSRGRAPGPPRSGPAD